MGLYDRDYVRQQPRRSLILGDRTMVTNLILLNVGLFVVDYVLQNRVYGKWLFDWMDLYADLFTHPWNAWQLITHGFAHEKTSIMHVGFNMFGLWFFGRDVEGIYGSREFLRIYLTLIVMAGLVWVAAENVISGTTASRAVGASGGVMGIMMLYVLHFPRRTILFWGVLPVPAWALGTFYIVGDFAGSFDSLDHVAHTAHLGGALFGFIYYRFGWNLGRMLPDFAALQRWQKRRRFRVHDPQDEPRDLGGEVDKILEKISREGEASLSAKERRTLEEASRRYQRRKR